MFALVRWGRSFATLGDKNYLYGLNAIVVTYGAHLDAVLGPAQPAKVLYVDAVVHVVDGLHLSRKLDADGLHILALACGATELSVLFQVSQPLYTTVGATILKVVFAVPL